MTLALNVPWDVPLFEGTRQLLSVTLPAPVYVPTRRVATATLVDPRTVVWPSRNRTNTRLVAGSSGMNPLPVTKTEKVEVCPPLICVSTLGPIGDVHWPVCGFVWQRLIVTGGLLAPVSAETVMRPLAPTLLDATENAPVPVRLGIFTIPSWLGVAARAITSGVGVAEAERSSVLTPIIGLTGLVFVPPKLNITSLLEEIAPWGVIAMT